MKILFVDLLNLFYDHHGLYSLSSVLKKEGAEVRFFGARHTGKALKAVLDYRPDLLMYSSFTTTLPIYADFDRAVKRVYRCVSLIGGAGPTYSWENLRGSTIDALCVGEGETAVVDFVRSGFKCAKNIFRPDAQFPAEFYPLADLDGLPFPDRAVVYDVDSLLRDNPTKQFFSGRGCPYRCTYCFNHRFHELFKGCGPLIRKKSVTYLLEEIRSVRHSYPLKELVFNDDTFIIDKQWFLEFAACFKKEIGLGYTCNVRANLIDEEIAAALKDSGCRNVNWSIESGDECLRNEVLKRGISDEQIVRAGAHLAKCGIPFRTGNMLGLPGETPAQMERTVELNIRVRPNFALANIFVPLPGLELTRYAEREGYYKNLPPENLPKDYFSGSVLERPAAEKIFIRRLLYLFPFFVRYPGLFRRKSLRRRLYLLPNFITRPIYELFYTINLAGFYSANVPLRYKARMAWRYLRNL